MKTKVTLYLTSEAKKMLTEQSVANGLNLSTQVETLVRERQKQDKK